VTLTLYGGRLDLPVRPSRPADESLAPFAPPETAPPLAVDELRAAGRSRTVTRDHVSGAALLEDRQDGGRFRILADGLTYDHITVDRYRIVEGDPLAARAESEQFIAIERGAWRTRIETRSAMTCDAAHFYLANALEAYEGETRVFAKTWRRAIPRDLV
jgi:hypothetical protein